jgi:hypothetical protein
MGRNAKYDKETVLEIIANYFSNKNKEQLFSQPFEKVYEEAKKFASVHYPSVKMPQFSQARKILITYLTEANLYKEGERLTTAVAYRILEMYIDADPIEEVLYCNNYNVLLHVQQPIVCTIQLPPVEILDALANGISKSNKTSRIWGRFTLIDWLCQRIKKRDPKTILAVVPQLSRAVCIKENGKIRNDISDLNPTCDVLCMFVKDTPEGRALVQKMKDFSISHEIQ